MMGCTSHGDCPDFRGDNGVVVRKGPVSPRKWDCPLRTEALPESHSIKYKGSRALLSAPAEEDRHSCLSEPTRADILVCLRTGKNACPPASHHPSPATRHPLPVTSHPVTHHPPPVTRHRQSCGRRLPGGKCRSRNRFPRERPRHGRCAPGGPRGAPASRRSLARAPPAQGRAEA